ncbi:hypothetical protein GGP91_003248 [Salinibacter ruber]|nr:hypothetical protein [Salinibacter ruber]MCS4057739.1 hypothetical protein [Salinibacter ruber]MCS4162771.1 hypothetical protein [Salinibacter ruber]
MVCVFLLPSSFMFLFASTCYNVRPEITFKLCLSI